MDAEDVGILLLIGLLLVGGLAFAVGGVVDAVRQAETVRSAEQTQGTVTAFFSRRVDDRAGPDDLADNQYYGGGSSDREYYRITVQYQYTVDGTTYSSRRLKSRYVTDTVVSNAIQMGDPPKQLQVVKRKRAWEYANRFREGKQVTVYYDPGNPASSYLLEWYSIWPYLMGMMGLFLLSVLPLPFVIDVLPEVVAGRFRSDESDDPDDDETPGVDVPVLSSFGPGPSTVEGVVSAALWGGFVVVLLWYPAHFSGSGDRLGTAIVGAMSAINLLTCYMMASSFG